MMLRWQKQLREDCKICIFIIKSMICNWLESPSARLRPKSCFLWWSLSEFGPEPRNSRACSHSPWTACLTYEHVSANTQPLSLYRTHTSRGHLMSHIGCQKIKFPGKSILVPLHWSLLLSCSFPVISYILMFLTWITSTHMKRCYRPKVAARFPAVSHLNKISLTTSFSPPDSKFFLTLCFFYEQH